MNYCHGNRALRIAVLSLRDVGRQRLQFNHPCRVINASKEYSSASWLSECVRSHTRSINTSCLGLQKSTSSPDNYSRDELVDDNEYYLHGTEEESDSYLLQLGGEAANHEHEIPLEGIPESASSLAAIVPHGSSCFENSLPAEKGEKLIKNELHKKHKEAAIQRSLRSYLSMCLHHNMICKVMLTLKHYHTLISSAKNPEVYDIVMKGAAKHGSWSLIQEVISMMQESQIPLSHNSYAACFECLGLSPSESSTQLSMELVNQLEASSMAVNDIFEKSLFTGDEKELTLKGIRMALPDFVPSKTPPILTYSLPLLEELNDLTADPTIVSPAEGVVSRESLLESASKQMQNELDGIIEIQSIAKKANDKEETSAGEGLEDQWVVEIKRALTRDLLVCRAQFQSSKKSTLHIFPYLDCLPKEDLLLLLVQELRTLSGGSETFSQSMHVLSRNLGVKVMRRFHIRNKEKNGILSKVKELYEKYCDLYLNPRMNDQLLNPRQQWQKLVSASYPGADIDVEDINWPHSVLMAVGYFLYNILLNDLKITVVNRKTGHKSLVPAFYVVYRSKGIKITKELKTHPSLVKFYQDCGANRLSFDAALLPMLSPPLPWNSHRIGGYLLSPVPLVRLPPHASQQKLRLNSTPNQQLYPALDALNALGAVPWKVNDKILDIIIDIFNNKGNSELDVAQPPSECPPPRSIHADMTQVQKALVHKERQSYRRRKAEMYSLWCDTLYRLSLANHFRGMHFWLPHNMDFRGRVYPCPPHLTHLSSDMARSLLQFAQAKPLGREGFRWLLIHLVNLTGLKKRDPVRERLQYAEDMMPEILDSARNPMTGNKWWTKSDEPWQTLAVCLEVAAALESQDPYRYMTHIPIHQDGSCNGLQHYAALGRDQAGAESVNLAPADRPQDVYNNVAILVERERAKDEANGLVIAKALAGLIKRKVIKQTVMTTVYGVTRFGARLQMVKQLKDLPDLPAEHLWPAAQYLVEKTFFSLQEMFNSAKEIQDWFTACAKLISAVYGQNVEWVTPLGLPVVQPYTKGVLKDSRGERENISDMYNRPNVMKQRNAFPPNFIHSLDSSHMMLTALFCQRLGITFASVHDCFWTHPSTVHIMNKACRSQFVALHSQPILEDLSKFLVANHAYRASDLSTAKTAANITRHQLNDVLTRVPRRGNFDLEQVLDSVYFFS